MTKDISTENKQDEKGWLNLNHLPAIRYDLSGEKPRLMILKGLFPLNSSGFSDEHNQDDF